MSRRRGAYLLALAVALVCASATLIAWRIWPVAMSKKNPSAIEAVAPAPPPPSKLSTIIDLPGDPVIVRRGAVAAPRETHFALPVKLGANAPKIDTPGFFTSGWLVSTNGGYMGKFPDSGDEADALAAQLAINTAVIAPGSGAGEEASDDDGGADTPADASAQWLTNANSNQIEIATGTRAALKQSIIKTVVAEKISELLIADGYSEDSARAIESAAKTTLNVQTLPPESFALAYGALDAAGAYVVTQLAIWEDREYVGAVALFESGFYGEAARPAIPDGALDDSAPATLAARYNLADGIYSAGLRNGMPEAVVREAIQLLGRLVDLKSPLPSDEVFRVLYSADFRGRSRTVGKVVFIGLTGSAGEFNCYAYEDADGAYRCFDPKAAASVPLPPTASGPASLGSSGAASVGGILAPIKGAPVTSLFGMRFHPILHILRLHAGIDFGAPVGSPVRAAADGKVEIAGPVQGFGNHVRLQHDGFETSYSHLSEIPASTHVGAEVKQGDVIALSGNTGLSTGPHLHFEFYLNRVAVDPLPHLGSEVRASAPIAGAPTPPVNAAAASRVSDAEVAAFPAFKAAVDAALDAAVH